VDWWRSTGEGAGALSSDTHPSHVAIAHGPHIFGWGKSLSEDSLKCSDKCGSCWRIWLRLSSYLGKRELSWCIWIHSTWWL
jgi:hypothetical protein